MTRPEPPYRRIVDDIRRRVAAGELRPGDRIPSARRITREWGVAIATATKVHAALREAGLSTVVPGVGTVVAAPATAPRRRTPGREPDADLSRDRIVRAAVDLADAHGMAEVSMRRIAAELGVATMSLYRHVSGKDELVLHMIDATFGEEPLPDTAPGDWQAAGWRTGLEQIARVMWAVFRRHPWLAPAMSITRPQLAPNALAITERVLGALERTDLSMEGRLYVHIALFSFVRGVATALEPEAEARRETGMTDEEWITAQEATLAELLDAGSPLLRHALQDEFDFDLDTLFEFGLARLLDGVAVYLKDGTPTGS